MSNDEATPVTTIRTSFERVAQSTCGLPQYESARALVSVEETFPGTLQPDEVASIVANQFIHAKGQVFTQLGIGFEQDELNVLRETFGDVAVIQSAPSAAGTAAAPRQAATGAPQRPVSRPGLSSPGKAPAGPAKAPAAPVRAAGDDDGYWQELMEQPGLWTDKRPDKATGAANDRGPDFVSTQHKEGRFFKGLWLNNAPDWYVDPYA
jgi:hypothetical protein